LDAVCRRANCPPDLMQALGNELFSQEGQRAVENEMSKYKAFSLHSFIGFDITSHQMVSFPMSIEHGIEQKRIRLLRDFDLPSISQLYQDVSSSDINIQFSDQFREAIPYLAAGADKEILERIRLEHLQREDKSYLLHQLEDHCCLFQERVKGSSLAGLEAAQAPDIETVLTVQHQDLQSLDASGIVRPAANVTNASSRI
jgi:hypothetical protein